ncbi:MAG: GDSL-type esterase/lipase family protein [Treponema sp.]|jgi:acyl-CoA thioesterase-1|nr:GDSL-type esterase/lipase family protein [Treponema sp.]
MKSKLFFVLCVVFSVVFMACATTGGSTSASTSVGETIVCLGDSLTSGAGVTVAGKDDKSKAWPAFLQNKVNIPVINAGVDGNTTAQGLARVKKDVLSKNPRIVIIVLGTNDYFQKVPLARTKNNLQKIIDMVNDGSRKIYLTSWYVNWDAQGWTAQVRNMFNTLASSNNIELVYGVFNGVVGVYFGADKFHPSAEGHEIIAEGIFGALKPYLEANNLLK